jgi:hypothetical protein
MRRPRHLGTDAIRGARGPIRAAAKPKWRRPGNGHERVVPRTAPDDHSKLAAVARGAPQVRECLDRILRRTITRIATRSGEAFRLERVGVRVGANEGVAVTPSVSSSANDTESPEAPPVDRGAVRPACALNCAVIVMAHDASGDTGQNCDAGILRGNREFWPVSSELDGIRFGLANRRLQPLGHLTAARKLSINDIAIYGLSNVPSIVPETVPASSQNRREAARFNACRAPIRTQRFFSPTAMPATD